MQQKSVCVPLHSPAWRYYLDRGWVERWYDGVWVTLTAP